MDFGSLLGWASQALPAHTKKPFGEINLKQNMWQSLFGTPQATLREELIDILCIIIYCAY